MSNIQKREITDELRESYLDYAMSVIVSRALPDVRDGLKPVQRRVLWGMWDSGLTPDAKLRKSANVVGEVMGRYHPHGDASIYDTLVRMAQDFSLRYPLVIGQGNWGSIDGDGPAAMRYTETKLSKISTELLNDIEKETVEWAPNYDATREEPRVLPAKLPNLLLNGAMGIAVGMATSIPPHNLSEVADAILYFAENPDAESEDLLKFIQGPDFPTGGIIFDKKAIKEAYTSGRGAVTTRAKTDITERKKGQHDIVITEIPYQVNKSDLLRQIADLVHNKKIEGVRDLRDESDREGLRVVVELKTDVPPQKVLNQLFKHTPLQKDFHLNMVALVDGLEPRLLTLRDFVGAYVSYRKEVIKCRTAYDLKRAEERAHILEGLSKALHSIDKIIATIKKSEDRDVARENLIKQFKFTELQANAILEMRLAALAALEREKIDAELKEKEALIKELRLVLKTPAKILKVLTDEVKKLKEAYGDARRTQVVVTGISTFREEDLIPNEETMITLSQGGYIKRLPPGSFTTQRRGGKGLIGSDVGEEDFLMHFVSAETHDDILFFTESGKVLQTKVYEIPAATRTAKGRAIHNFLEIPPEEHISAIVPYNRKDDASAFLVMVTKNGLIKKTALGGFVNIRRAGIVAVKLKRGDSLVGAQLSSGKDEIVLTTSQGQAIRFKETVIRPMGRTAAGVRAIRLKKSSDVVAGFDVIGQAAKTDPSTTVLVVMKNGFGKQTSLKEYKLQNRGGSGIKTAKITGKTGPLISGKVITGETEIFALSKKGQMIRTELKGVRTAGRATQGVRVMNVKPGDSLAAIVVL